MKSSTEAEVEIIYPDGAQNDDLLTLLRREGTPFIVRGLTSAGTDPSIRKSLEDLIHRLQRLSQGEYQRFGSTGMDLF